MTEIINDKSDYTNCIPSYRMQTISSMLKIVEKGRLQQSISESRIPFTVGTSYTTHNVELLKQETLNKMKSLLLVVKHENLVDVKRDIKQLRLLKQDIETFGDEAMKLMGFTQNKRKLFNYRFSTTDYGDDQDEYLDSRNVKQGRISSYGFKPLHGFNGDVNTMINYQDQLQNILREKVYSFNERPRTYTNVPKSNLEPITKNEEEEEDGEGEENVNVLDEKTLSARSSATTLIHDGTNTTSYNSSKKKTKKRKKRYVGRQDQQDLEDLCAKTNPGSDIADAFGECQFFDDPPTLHKNESFMSVPKISSSKKRSEYSFRTKKTKLKKKKIYLETNAEEKDDDNDCTTDLFGKP